MVTVFIQRAKVAIHLLLRLTEMERVRVRNFPTLYVSLENNYCNDPNERKASAKVYPSRHHVSLVSILTCSIT